MPREEVTINVAGGLVKNVRVPTSGPNMGKLVITQQDADGTEETLALTFSGGMIAPTPVTTAAVIWADSATPAEADFGSPVGVDEARTPTYPASPSDPLYIVAWRSGATPDEFTLTVSGTVLMSSAGGSTFSAFSIGGVAGVLSYYETTPGFFAELFGDQRAVFS